MVFFDSNVLIYVLARGDARQDVAFEMLSQGGVISVQVLNEFANVAHRKFGLLWTEVHSSLSAVRAFVSVPRPITVRTHERALTLLTRYSLSLWDALIVASALEAECEVVLSEDMHHGLIVEDRLTIRNPFRDHP